MRTKDVERKDIQEQEHEPDPQAPLRPAISVIVPTYKEVENLPFLIDRLRDLRRNNSMDLELLIMDDDSGDGTAELIAGLREDWI